MLNTNHRHRPRPNTTHPVELADRLIPDQLWNTIAPLLPPNPTRPQGGGRRRHEDRTILVAITYVLTTNTSWRNLPTWCGVTPATAYRRFREWTDTHVWTQLANTHPHDTWTHTIAQQAIANAANPTTNTRP